MCDCAACVKASGTPYGRLIEYTTWRSHQQRKHATKAVNNDYAVATQSSSSQHQIDAQELNTAWDRSVSSSLAVQDKDAGVRGGEEDGLDFDEGDNQGELFNSNCKLWNTQLRKLIDHSKQIYGLR